jgi:ribonuclease R
VITEEQVLEFMRERAYKPMTVQELEDVFEVRTSDQLKQFIKLLNDMEDRGEVIRTRTDRFGVPERMNLVVGKLQVKAKGFGFVIPDEPNQPDVYIQASDLNGAMHGDRVMARLQNKTNGPRMEGEIIRILERGTTQIVGTLTKYPNYGFVTPDDRKFGPDIFIAQEDINGAEDSQKVVVQITRYSDGYKNSQGKIVEVLGNPNDPGVDILSVIRKYGLPEAFPPEVMAEAERVPLEISEEEIRGRRDLRGRKMVTIDGEDAKDLDDAVSIERLPNGNYLLGVHIADVGYYVPEGSALDKEAYNRGCSVYLVDRVIPMLPHRLSNGICSLNPQVNRLTLTCDMEFSPDLELVRHDIYPSVIKTNERMTYTNVKKILVDQDPELMERYADLVEDFRMMEELAMKLRNRRMERGAIDFDFQETKIIVDDLGKPVEIRKRERSVAERIIEEFMLVANETVAEHFYWLQVPFLYRIHEDPDFDRIMAFNEFLHNFGYSIKGVGNNRVHPRSLQELLEKVSDTPEERIISTIMLRSLRQAKYSSESSRHFGLSADYYTHFTSPIRRYPDLVIHRIIREIALKGALTPERQQHLLHVMEDIARQSSERERLAVDAERETDNLKKVEYMMDKIGEEFDGIISGVTQFGMFVELENSIEGLVHVSYLNDDYYNYFEKQYALIGERTGNTFRIGDSVRVRVIGANKETISIDFELISEAKPMRRRRRDGQETASGGRKEFNWQEMLEQKRNQKRGKKGKQSKRGKQGKSGVVAYLEPEKPRGRKSKKRTKSQTRSKQSRSDDKSYLKEFGKSESRATDRADKTVDDYLETYKVEASDEFDLTRHSVAEWEEEFGNELGFLPNDRPDKKRNNGLRKIAKKARRKRGKK